MENKSEQQPEEQVNIRHTITAEETFTLAKDIFDIRCFLKNVYANRAVISRRLNILTLSVSTIFTLLYSAYVIFVGLTKMLGLELQFIVICSMLGVYALAFVILITVSVLGGRSGAKGVKKVKRTISILTLFVRLLAVAISVTAIVFSASDGQVSAESVTLNVLIIVFSIITIIFQVFPLIFGGTGKLVRWLLSPVKTKHRFSKVILEWYELAVSGSAKEGAVKKVSSKYFEHIGALIDTYLLPVLGKKYITAIKPAQLLGVVARASEEDRPVLEGVLKNAFSYAAECGYVIFDPCKDLNFEGSVEEEEKPSKPTLKKRLFNIGSKIGKSMLNKYISENSADDKK